MQIRAVNELGFKICFNRSRIKYNFKVLIKKYFLHLDQSPRERLFIVKKITNLTFMPIT